MSAPHATVLVVDEEAIVEGLAESRRRPDPAPGDASLSLLEAERRHIAHVLKSHQGRVEEAARVLGLSRSALYQKLKKHQIPTRSRAGA